MTDLQWQIDDPWFYPLGIATDASPSKVVFVTWTYDHLLSFVFKKQTDQPPILTDIIKVETEEVPMSVQILKANTLVLMKGSGELHYFKSTRTLENIPGLQNIRCLGSTEDGFCIVRVQEDGSIFLEAYKDFQDVFELETEVHKFDITFDEENYFSSTWNDENFTIESSVVREDNNSFLELLSKTNNISIGTRLYFFGISKNLFCLSSENGNIQHIMTLFSDIVMIKTLKKVLLVFLSCGIIEILFESQLVKMVDKITHISGANFKHFCFSESSFYYSDGNHIGKLDFDYDEIMHTCQVKTETQDIPGICGIVWAGAIRKLVCLNENNIFYRIKFKNASSQMEKSTNEVFELTSERLGDIKQRKSSLETTLNEPERIRKSIEQEIVKQEVLAIATKTHLYDKLFESSVSVHAELSRHSCYAEVFVKASQTDIFDSAKWKLAVHLKFEAENCSSWFSFGKENIGKNTVYIVNFPKKYLEGSILPIVELVCNVSVQKDSLPVAIPIKVIDIDYKGLFSQTQKNRDGNDVEIKDIISNVNGIAQDKCNIAYCSNIKIPSLMSFADIYEFFGFPMPMQEQSTLKAYLFNHSVTVEYKEAENVIHISADHPLSAYYAKVLIAKGLHVGEYDMEEELLDAEDRRKNALKLLAQCDSLDLEIGDHEYVQRALWDIYQKKRDNFLNFS